MQRRSVNNSRIPDVAWEDSDVVSEVFIQRADRPRVWPFHCDGLKDQDCPNAAGDDRHDWPLKLPQRTGLESTNSFEVP